METIKCLNCGGENFEYYESGDYSRNSKVKNGIIETFNAEPYLSEADSELICLSCGTEFDFELNTDGRSIKSISRK